MPSGQDHGQRTSRRAKEWADQQIWLQIFFACHVARFSNGLIAKPEPAARKS